MESAFTNRVQVIYSINPIVVLYYDYFGNQLSDIPENWNIDEPVSKEDSMNQLREYRNQLLVASDWTQIPDSPLSDAQRIVWRTYRQQLRDYPSLVNYNLWTAPEWPIAPW